VVKLLILSGANPKPTTEDTECQEERVTEINPTLCKTLTIVTTRAGHISYLAHYFLKRHTSFKMLETEQLVSIEPQDSSPEAICASVAAVFKVRKTEVALLEVSGNVLKFLYPAELTKVGAIPLSSSAVAARTARTRKSDLFNTFTRVKHSSVFEVVKLGATSEDTEVIQKLMTVPILNTENQVIGVIQISRKAYSPAKAGDDFTTEDLRKLESVAVDIAKVLKKNGQ
jgi:hypothetical protein